MDHEHFIFRKGGGTGINMRRNKLVGSHGTPQEKVLKLPLTTHGMFYLQFRANLAVFASIVQGGFIRCTRGSAETPPC